MPAKSIRGLRKALLLHWLEEVIGVELATEFLRRQMMRSASLELKCWDCEEIARVLEVKGK